MIDTPHEIEQLVRAQIMACSPTERFLMDAEMFDCALVVKASLPTNPSRSAYKRQLFNAFTDLSYPSVPESFDTAGKLTRPAIGAAQTVAAFMIAEQNAPAI